MTKVKLMDVAEMQTAKEGYQTLKKRLFTNEKFIEMTIDGQKGVANKANIARIVEEAKEVKQTAVAPVKKESKK